MSNEIVEQNNSMESTDVNSPLSAEQIVRQVELIKNVMESVMRDGTHYGKIPGCGEKPTLLKAGAEKLSLTFRLRPIMDNERDVIVEKLDGGHINIKVFCHVQNYSGVELATGVGSCSTMESKYKYRGGTKIATGMTPPKEYWNTKKEGDLKKAQELIGGAGYGVAKIDGIWQICEIGEKTENPDLADTYNTVLKMAKKRAYVDGMLSATAASDIFTQDIEDFSQTEKTSTKQPTEKMEEPKRESEKEITPNESKTAENPAELNLDKPKKEGLISIRDGIKEIKSKSGVAKNGKPYVRHTVVSADGTYYNTFDEKLAVAAQTAKNDGVVVEFVFTTSNFGNNLEEIKII